MDEMVVAWNDLRLLAQQLSTRLSYCDVSLKADVCTRSVPTDG